MVLFLYYPIINFLIGNLPWLFFITLSIPLVKMTSSKINEENEDLHYFLIDKYRNKIGLGNSHFP